MTGFRVTNAVIVLVVLTAAGIAAWQLARVVTAAQSISAKAARISETGRGINIATDSVVQLSRTNRTADSILESAQPLDEELAGVVSEARGIDQVAGAIDRTAGSIDTTAGAIDSTAGQIDTTAGAIDSTAGAILGTAGDINQIAGDINSTAGEIRTTAGRIDSSAGAILREAEQIDRDVFLINFFLNGSIDVAALIDSDLDKVLDLAIAAHDTAACIDDAVGGSDDGDCRDLPSNGDFGPDNGEQREGTARLGRRGGPGPMGGSR